VKKKLVWVAVGVAVLAGAVVWVRARQARAKGRVRFETAQVDRGRVVARVTATGTLSALVTVQVGTQVSGAVAALYADFNSTVKKGQLIAKIDPRLFDAAVKQARANLVAAEGNLAKARAQAVDAARQYDRSVELFKSELLARSDLDTAQATADANKAGVDAAVGAVEQARAQLNQAEVNLAYTDIRSPTDGTVISRNVDVGQTVAASLAAPTLFLIAEDIRKMQVDTSVAEADIGRLQSGMRASFSVDAYPGERFSGRVRQVRNSPQTVQNVVTYDAVIDVDNAELKLKPGMTANCTFVYAERDAALRVPNAAMRFLPPPEFVAAAGKGSGRPGSPGPRAAGGAAVAAGSGGGGGGGGGASAAAAGRRGGPRGEPSKRTVWVLRDGKPNPVAIRTGVSDGSLTEVLEGELAEDDLVITDLSAGSEARPGAAGAGAGFPRRGL
jgi:HlyD family secretion protein